MASATMVSNIMAVPTASLSASKVSTGSSQLRAFGLPQLSVRRQVRSVSVRAAQQQQKENAPLAGTKVDITESDVKNNEGKEPLRVFDQTAAGKFARPESERRPELGNTDFQSLMKFDGPAPETINGRLAMVGITWAFVAELTTGLSVTQQTVGSTGLIWFLAVVPLFIWASFVPIFGWNESPDSRSFGPFNAKAERWNGRAAMIGFVCLLFTENFLLKGPLFGMFHM
jgi:hypothetical protein